MLDIFTIVIRDKKPSLGSMKALLFTLLTLSAFSQELSFLEKYANPATRAESLNSLVPHTRDWFFYHALFQLEKNDAAYHETIKTWLTESHDHKNPVSKDGMELLKQRAILLKSKTDPADAAQKIQELLQLSFNHERASAISARNTATSLDQELISEKMFEAEAEKRNPSQAWRSFSMHRLFQHLKDLKTISKDERSQILNSLPFSTHPAVVELMAVALDADNESFGSLNLGKALVHEQLEALYKKVPSLKDDKFFAFQYLQTLRPADDSNFSRDHAQLENYLKECQVFADTLPAHCNDLKAEILLDKLDLTLKIGKPSREDFLALLALPIRNNPIRPLNNHDDENRADACDWSDDESTVIAYKRSRKNAELMDILLTHFLKDTDDAAEFTKLIPDNVLSPIHARARLMNGADEKYWSAFLSSDEVKSLREKTMINFSPTQPERFTTNDNVSLLLDCKNTPQLTLRIYTLDLASYLKNHSEQPDATLTLDGLVPHHERVVNFSQESMKMHRETIALPELTGAGAWMVECISHGVASRALIRKGELIPFMQNTAEGHVLQVFDEARMPVKKYHVQLQEQHFDSDENGKVTIPYLTDRSEEMSLIISNDTLATKLNQARSQAAYVLSSVFHLDREQVLPDQEATLYIQPSLKLNDCESSLALVKNASLKISYTLASGKTSEQSITNLKLAKEMTLSFRVPHDATVMSLNLRGELMQAGDANPVLLEAKSDYSFNGSITSAKIYSAFFTPTEHGQVLEIRGRNGESAAKHSVTLSFRHRDFKDSIVHTLQTDEQGRVLLGELKDIVKVNVLSDEISHASLDLQKKNIIPLPSVIDVTANQEIKIPLGAADEIRDLDEVSLVEIHKNEQDMNLRSHHESLSWSDSVLRLNNLTAGTYDLLLGKNQVRIFVSPASDQAGILASAEKIIPVAKNAPLRISSIKIEGDAVKVQLADVTKNTAVSMIGTRFFPQWDLASAYSHRKKMTPSILNCEYQPSSFLINRTLYEETRYVLDRRNEKLFPGDMLPQAGVLLNRITEQEDQAQVFTPAAERQGKLLESGSGGSDMLGSNVGGGERAENADPSYDFLPSPSTVQYQLKADANGQITLPLEKLKGCRMLTVFAYNDGSYHQKIIHLKDEAIIPKTQQLTKSLDTKKHFVGLQRGSIVKANEPVKITNMIDERWQAYQTVADVFQFFAAHTTSTNGNMANFHFLTRWNTLTQQQKLEYLNQYACHEFHLFLYQKDRSFFDQHVKPSLTQKLEKSFIDHYVLENDLTPYLELHAYAKLNVAEKALLARRLPDAAARIKNDLQERYNQQPFNAESELQLFAQAVNESAIMLDESSSTDQNESCNAQPRIIQKINSIMIPEIDFEDVSVEDAINFLRIRSKELDNTTTVQEEKGVNFVVRIPRTSGGDASPGSSGAPDPNRLRIKQLKLSNVPLQSALKYICDATRLKYKIDDFAVTIVPISEESDDIVTRTFNVPSDIISVLAKGSEDSGFDASDPFSAKPASPGAKGLAYGKDIVTLLKEKGVSFPEGSSAFFDARNSRLIVRNTPTNMDLIETIAHFIENDSNKNPAKLSRKNRFAKSEMAGMDPFSSDNGLLAAPAAAAAYSDSSTGLLPNPRPASPVPSEKVLTRIYREQQYYREKENNLIAVNRFWVDVAAWDKKGVFLSEHFIECQDSLASSLMALALLDLPFTAEQSEVKRENDVLTIQCKQPMLLFFRDTHESNNIEKNPSVLVRQSFYPLDARFREVNGKNVENTLDEDGYVVGRAYGCTMLIANPTGEEILANVLWQIPTGAVPLSGSSISQSVPVNLQPYENQTLTFSFYFPQVGDFTIYPFHVTTDEKVLAYSTASVLHVAQATSETNENDFPAIADHGSNEAVLQYIREKDIRNVPLEVICWRLKDQAFYQQVIQALKERLYFHATIYSYAFYHKDTAGIRDYLENAAPMKNVGSWLDTPFYGVNPRDDFDWRLLDFEPFVNPRAHRLGTHPQLPLQAARDYYTRFLSDQCYKEKWSDDERSMLVIYLLMQNRNDEALVNFDLIDEKNITQKSAYDFLKCHILFLREKPSEAAQVAKSHLQDALTLWQNKFQAVATQAEEIAKAEIATTENAKAAISDQIELKDVGDGTLLIKHADKKDQKCELRFYQVDQEMLFSANPFMEQTRELHNAIRPNQVVQVQLAGTETTFPIPDEYKKGDVIVAVENQGRSTAISLNSDTLRTAINHSSGELQVIANHKPLPKAYVKVYVQKKDGSIEFHKDGYTDLRGKFNYRSHNNTAPNDVEKFAIFISHNDYGTRTESF